MLLPTVRSWHPLTRCLLRHSIRSIDDACRQEQLKLGVHERALEVSWLGFQAAGGQDRHILQSVSSCSIS